MLRLELAQCPQLGLQGPQLLLHLLHLGGEPMVTLLLGPELLPVAFLGEDPGLLALQLFLLGNQLLDVLMNE